MRYGVIELYPSGIGLTMTNPSFYGRMSSPRSIDPPRPKKPATWFLSRPNLPDHLFDQARTQCGFHSRRPSNLRVVNTAREPDSDPRHRGGICPKEIMSGS